MSPRTKIQNYVIRHQSKTAIEEAALDLFGHQGYANTSIAQIARKAGVSKGLLYNYYTNKADLLRAIVMNAVKEGEEIMNPEIFNNKTPIEVLCHLADQSVEMAIKHRAYWKLITSLALQDEVIEEFGDFIKEKGEANIVLAAPLFEALGYPNPRAQVYLFGAALDGIILQLMSLDKDYPLKLVLDQFKSFFCKPYSI